MCTHRKLPSNPKIHNRDPSQIKGTLKSPDPEALAKRPSDQPGLHSSVLWALPEC